MELYPRSDAPPTDNVRHLLLAYRAAYVDESLSTVSGIQQTSEPLKVKFVAAKQWHCYGHFYI